LEAIKPGRKYAKEPDGSFSSPGRLRRRGCSSSPGSDYRKVSPRKGVVAFMCARDGRSKSGLPATRPGRKYAKEPGGSFCARARSGWDLLIASPGRLRRRGCSSSPGSDCRNSYSLPMQGAFKLAGGGRSKSGLPATSNRLIVGWLLMSSAVAAVLSWSIQTHLALVVGHPLQAATGARSRRATRAR